MNKVLATLIILCFSFSMAYGAVDETKAKMDFGRKNVPVKVWNKLTGPLKLAAEVYMTRATLATKNAPNAKMKAFYDKAKYLTHSSGKQVYVGKRNFTPQEMLPSVLLDPFVQKRWKNPSFDVLKCLIKTTGDPKALENHNLKVTSVSDLGDFKIVSVEMSALDLVKIAKMDSVKQISPVVQRVADNDRGTINTGASMIRLKQGGEYRKGYTGHGVVVGVIDSGIDWSHGDFNNVNGTRVKYIWDAENDTPGKSPADIFGGNLSTLDWGTVWTKEEIDAGLCTQVDTNGHGTHVAGSAAGNGNATGEYTGMAPNADIVFVKGLNAAGNLGILFIYDVSSRMGKPCTVNMSYGPGSLMQFMPIFPDNYPADGTSPDALMIKGFNEAYGAGHIPIKSGGNNGEWPSWEDYDFEPYPVGGWHSGAYLNDTSHHTLMMPNYNDVWVEDEWGISPMADFYPVVDLGCWYDSPVQVTFVTPGGRTIGPMVHGTAGMVSDPHGVAGDIYYDLSSAPYPNNGSYYGTFLVVQDAAPFYPAPGNWDIVVEPIDGGSGRFDIWASEHNYFFGFTFLTMGHYTRFNGPDAHSHYVLDEGTSPYEITVSWWTTRLRWPSVDGGYYSFSRGEIMGAIAPGASPGPSRDMRVKPDISAPGNVIISALSKDSSWASVWEHPDGMHVTAMGASMATPHVAGGVALMLEKNPNMNVRQVREQIKSFARHDRHTRQWGMLGFGYGKFNVKPLNDPPVAMITATKMNGMIKFDASASYDPEGFPITYEFVVDVVPVDGTSTPVYNESMEGNVYYIQPDMAVPAYYRVGVKVMDQITKSQTTYSDWVLIQ